MRSRKRKGAEQAEPADASVTGAQPGGDERRLLPVDIQQKEFRLAFRGYNEHDVDEFLDQVTEELARLHEENKRLSERTSEAGASPYGGAAPGALIEDAQRRAEEIVREAREQAAAVLSSASSASAEGAVPAVPARGDVRTFLSREREFLQGLAGLIQQHAEAVKHDAQRVRSAAPPQTESDADADVSDGPTATPEPAIASPATAQPDTGDAWRSEPETADAWSEPPATRLEPPAGAPEFSPVESPVPERDLGSAAGDDTAAWDAPAPPWSEPSNPPREQSWSSPSASEEPAIEPDPDPDPDPDPAGRMPSAPPPPTGPTSGPTSGEAGRPGSPPSVLEAPPAAVPPQSPPPAAIPFPSTSPSGPSPSATPAAPVPSQWESREPVGGGGSEQPTLGEPAAPGGREEDDRSLRELFWGEE